MLKDSNIEKLEEEEKSIRSKILEIEGKIFLIHRSITLSEDAEKQIEELLTKNLEIAEENDGIKHKQHVLELTKEAFGSKGIKTVAVDFLIPRLEDKINEILSQLSDFRVSIDTQKEKADGSSSTEGLFINIYNDQGETFDFNNYSGGERLKITVAISEALASLQNCGFRIFDELFIGLDEDSIYDFSDVLSRLQVRFGQIMCISHLQTIKDLFYKKINVVKSNGISRIQ